MLLIHAADVHLDSPLRGLDQYEGAPVDEVRGATRRALENLVRYVIREKADLLLIAGDLYDGDWKDFSTGLFFAARMRELREHNIPVGLVRGNHDAENAMTRSLELPDNVFVFSSDAPETWRPHGLNVAVHGQSYAKKEVRENLAANYPPPVEGVHNIGLLHTMVTTAGAEHKRYAPSTVAELAAKGYDYWALGHVHDQGILNQSPPVVYAGCLQGRHIKEPGPSGCYRVEFGGGSPDVQFEPMDVMRWATVEVDVTGAETTGHVTDRFTKALQEVLEEAEGKPLAVRVMLKGRCKAHGALQAEREVVAANIRAMASNLDKVWVEKVLIETRPDLDLDALRHGDGPVAELLRYLDELADDPAVLAELQPEMADLRAKVAQAGVTLSDVGAGGADHENLVDAVRDEVLALFTELPDAAGQLPFGGNE